MSVSLSSLLFKINDNNDNDDNDGHLAHLTRDDLKRLQVLLHPHIYICTDVQLLTPRGRR